MTVDPAPRGVVITGASSGIGRATARAFAARGARLVLTARNAEALDDAAAECLAAGALEVHIHAADVLDPAAVHALAHAAHRQLDDVDVLVHAAGVMAYGTIEALPADVVTRVIDTMIHGTVHLAQAFLPIMRRQGHGLVLVVNSILGDVAVPGMGAYIAAKWGQRGLARVLQLETRDAPGVDVTIVSLGAVDTPIYRRAANYAGRPGQPPPPVYSPERVAARLVRHAERRRTPSRYLSIGFANPVMAAGFRAMPWLYDRIVGPVANLVIFGKERIPASDGNVFSSTPDRSATRQALSQSTHEAGKDF